MLRPRSRALAATALALPAVLCATVAAGGSTRHSTEQLRKGAYVNRIRVPGGYTHSLAVDRSGGNHWRAAGRAYYTLFPGDRKATRAILRKPHGFTSTTRPLLHDIVASVNGKQIDIVAANCSEMQVISVSRRTRVLPALRRSDDVARASCPSDGQGFSGPSEATALAHGRVAVLFQNDPKHPIGGQSAVYVGRPGHHFARHILPDFDTVGVYGAAIARDPVNGSLWVAEATKGGAVHVWSARTSHVPFRQPKLVGAVGHNEFITSMAASHHMVWVGLTNYYGRPYGNWLITRDAHGRWATPRHVGPSHSLGIDLAVDPVSSHPSAWEADTLTAKPNGYRVNDGVELRHLTAHGVGKAERYTAAQYSSLNSIAVRWSGGVSVAFEVG
jgi:hypothetical protein